MIPCRAVFLSLCLAWCGLFAVAEAPADDADRGVVVLDPSWAQSTAAREQGAEPPLNPGDRIKAWALLDDSSSPAGASWNPLSSVWDWLYLEVELLPRGPVRLRVLRDKRSVEIRLDSWQQLPPMRPVWPPGSGPLTRRCELLLNEARPGPAWLDLARDLQLAGHHGTAAWWLSEWLRLSSDEELRPAQLQAQARATHKLASHLSPRRQAFLRVALARAWQERRDVGAAEAAWRELREFVDNDPTLPLTRALALHSQGANLNRRGDLDSAEPILQQALRLRRQLAPGSRALAKSLRVLGILKTWKGQWEEAEAFFREVQTLARTALSNKHGDERYLSQHARGHLARANLDLGQVLWLRFDLDQAEQVFHQAMLWVQTEPPVLQQLATTLASLAALALERGQLDSAESYQQQAVSLARQLHPDSLHLAALLSNLGQLTSRLQEPRAAAAYLDEAQTLYDQLAPHSLSTAANLSASGQVARQQKQWVKAEALERRALALRRELAPSSPLEAESLRKLGILQREKGRLQAGRELLLRSLAILETKPIVPELIPTLSVLGDLERRLGSLDLATERLRRALRLDTDHRAPSSARAELLGLLAKVQRDQGNNEVAWISLQGALHLLDEDLLLAAASSPQRSQRHAQLGWPYRLALDLLASEGRVEEAWEVYGRYRARHLHRLIAGRDLSLPGVPPGLISERRQTDAAYGRALLSLSRLHSDSDPEERRTILQEIQSRRQDQRAVRAKIRHMTARPASAQTEASLGGSQVSHLLGTDTLMLAYAVLEEHTLLFAVGPGSRPIQAFVVPSGETDLAQQVAGLREQLRPSQASAAVRLRAGPLSDLLLRPVADRLHMAERLVLVPDGPLHHLPFATLLQPQADGTPSGQRPFLIENLALVVTPSPAVLQTLRRRDGRGGNPGPVIAFGDPVYAPPDPAPAATAGVASPPGLGQRSLSGGFTPGPLPSSRQEVQTLARLAAPEAKIFLGTEASEEMVLAQSGQAGILHLACHAVSDPERPLESALVLSSPTKTSTSSEAKATENEDAENGLLQAWEVIERLELSAALVTLSACETGLGRPMVGEGMLGLIRAFQIAGARSVLASQWRVDDYATAHLMERFYRRLLAGEQRDQALRHAQLELLRGEAGSGLQRPFHWAAFQLHGDWL